MNADKVNLQHIETIAQAIRMNLRWADEMLQCITVIAKESIVRIDPSDAGEKESAEVVYNMMAKSLKDSHELASSIHKSMDSDGFGDGGDYEGAMAQLRRVAQKASHAALSQLPDLE